MEPSENRNPLEERHYTVPELAAMWNFSREFVRQIVRGEPGVTEWVRQQLQRLPELTRGYSSEVDHPEVQSMRRASADAHQAALPHLPSVVCAGRARRSSPTGVFGPPVPGRPTRPDPSLLASA